MFRRFVPAFGGRLSWIAGGMVIGGALVIGVLAADVVSAQQAAAAPPPARTFAPDGGFVLHFIKPDKTADFEAVMAKVKEALQKSEKPERKQQAQGWKLFKSPDPTGTNPATDDVLYVFVIDPAVKGADYNVSNILAEAFPVAEVNALYTKYAGAYGKGQQPINLGLISDFGK